MLRSGENNPFCLREHTTNQLMKTALDLIAEERARQIAKGFTPQHDLSHSMGELTEAAQCYATVGSAMIRGSSAAEWPASMFDGFSDGLLQWPWEEEDYRPEGDARSNLVKAAALLVAEIERINRAAGVPLS